MRTAVLCCLVLFAASGAVGAGEYGQWRGPDRNGVAAPGPALASAWPKAGPPKLWYSERLPCNDNTGYGSVAVAAGRAYLYTGWKYNVPIPTRKLSKQALRQLGFFGVKLPEELEKAVEAARVSEERGKVVRKDLKAWVQKWVGEHLKTDEDKKKYGGFVTDRLNRGKNAMPLEVLAKLATIQDKQFPDQAAMDQWFADNDIGEKLKKTVMRRVPTFVTKAWDKLFCFDLADGKKVWEAKFDGRPHGNGASSTPCVVDDRCYAAGSNGMVYCLNAATGEEIWKTRAAPRGGLVNSSVLVADGAVVVLAGQLTALDAKTGELRWRKKEVAGADSSPVAWKSGGKTYAICNTGKDVACVELKTGEVLWTAPGGGRSTAAVAGDHMVVFSERKQVGLAAYKLSGEKAEKLWSKGKLTDRGASAIIHDGHVYAVGAGQAVCVELDSGEVLWQQKIGGNEITSPVLADGKIFVIAGGGLCMIEASPAKYNLLAKAKLPISAYPSPAVAGGRLYLRLGAAIGCYDATEAAVKAAMEEKKKEEKK